MCHRPHPLTRSVESTGRVPDLGGLGAPLVFAVVVVIAGRAPSGYSHVDQFKSELGATGTAVARFKNGAGFILPGVLLLAFTMSTRRLAPGDTRASFGTSLLFPPPGGVVAAGFIRCDVGCPVLTGSWAK